MKQLLKYSLIALALCAMASCAKEPGVDTTVDPNEGKELIAFSQEGNGITKASLTKAGFTSETTVQMRIKAEAPAQTARYAKATATASVNIASDDHSSLVGSHSDLSYVDGQERYWDDAFGRASQLTVYAFAIPNKTSATLPTWSDEGWTAISATLNPNWFTGTEYTTVNWEVQTVQDTQDKMDIKDLTFSNNIKSGSTVNGLYKHTYNSGTSSWDTSMDAGQMVWRPKTDAVGETTGKFDQGHLVFNHALAWIEINLKEGAGFNNSANTDFVWTTGGSPAAIAQNITLKTFNTSGTFDVSTGSWSSQSANNITKMNEKTTMTNYIASAAQTTRQLWAYVVPGNNLYETSSNVVEFEIDNAKYYVTGTQIANAIRDYYKLGGAHENEDHAAEYRAFTVTEAGKHYVINLTVAKKGIERITAAIVDWETVNSSDADAKNTYPTFSLEDRGTRLENTAGGNQFNLYRSAHEFGDYITSNEAKDYSWSTGYNTDGAATKTWDSTDSEWSTNWYWENNLTAYHFRAAGYTEGNADPLSMTISTNTTPDPDIDYFGIASGAIGGGTYKDYIWGAPFEDITSETKLTYSTVTGFDNTNGDNHQISYAIGSTESIIHMLLFHMTSQIFITVQTTADDQPDKVNLFTDADHKTVVKLLRMKTSGEVQMGDGLVTATGEPVAMTEITYTGNENIGGAGVDKVKYSYGLVPQVLSRGSNEADKIGLQITTPDGNQYVVKDISTCTATVSQTNLTIPYAGEGPSYTIDRWYPNYQYTYTITIKKTGIERITAAVVPWETVNGDLGTIDLEN